MSNISRTVLSISLCLICRVLCLIYPALCLVYPVLCLAYLLLCFIYPVLRLIYRAVCLIYSVVCFICPIHVSSGSLELNMLLFTFGRLLFCLRTKFWYCDLQICFVITEGLLETACVAKHYKSGRGTRYTFVFKLKQLLFQVVLLWLSALLHGPPPVLCMLCSRWCSPWSNDNFPDISVRPEA